MNKRQKTAFLVLGLLLLIGFAYAGSVSHSPTLSMATGSQSAAVWWSAYTPYDGWPAPHYVLGGNKMCDGVSPGTFLCGWCQAPGNCPLPSYAAAYPAADPTQAMVAKVILPGQLAYPNQNTYRPYQGPTYSGSSVSVLQGQGVTLEWACQNWQAYSYSYGGVCTSYDAFGNCNGWSGGGTGQQYFYDYGPAVGIGFTAGSNVGKTTVYPVQTTTYGVYCPASGWRYNQFWTPLPKTPTMSFTVNVGGVPPPPPLPTETIDAGAGPGVTKTVTTGTPVTITATYAAHGTDTLLQTAIDGPNSTDSVPGVPFGPPFSPKQYVFTPDTAGSYIFYPSLQSSNYPAWNNYGAQVTVVATPIAACAAPHTSGPPTCACDIGYTGPNGGPCVPATCTDPNTTGPPTCACKAGYAGPDGGPCVLSAPPTVASFSVSPVRVAKNKATTVTFSWSGTNLPPGGCSISGTAISGAASPKTASITIAQTTVYTLTCGTATKQATVGLLPTYIEI